MTTELILETPLPGTDSNPLYPELENDPVGESWEHRSAIESLSENPAETQPVVVCCTG